MSTDLDAIVMILNGVAPDARQMVAGQGPCDYLVEYEEAPGSRRSLLVRGLEPGEARKAAHLVIKIRGLSWKQILRFELNETQP